jgi:hypothetical protein
VEGVYIPPRNDVSHEEHRLLGPGNDLFAYFEGPKHQGTGATSGLDAEDADFIDAILRSNALSDSISVDRTRLRESHEAWVHVLVHREEENQHDLKIFCGLGPYPRPGILTWTNTD